MADKVIDIATLGSREVEYYQTEGVVDPKSGMRTLQEVKKKRVEPQPVLTPEEAEVLKGYEWTRTTGRLRVAGGRYMCMAGGRRFFCNVNPANPHEESVLGGRVEDITKYTKAQLADRVMTIATDMFPNSKGDFFNERALSNYIKERDLGKPQLNLNTKQGLADIINAMLEDDEENAKAG